MARANLIISEYGSLNFDNDWQQSEQQHSDFSHKVVKGDIVTVQYGIPRGIAQTWQRVDVAQYDRVPIGGRNYVLNSDQYLTTPGYIGFGFSPLAELRGKPITVSVDVQVGSDVIIGSSIGRVGFEPSFIYVDGTQQYFGAWYDITPGQSFKGRITAIYNVEDKEIVGMDQRGIYVQAESGTVKVGHAKLELGTVPTDWTPAPEDRQEVLPASPASAIDDYLYYNVAIDTTQLGCYTAAIEVTNNDGSITTVAEAFFEVVDELPGSVLFSYQNVKNKDNTVFSNPFSFRCPAKFFPQNEEYSAEDNEFRDQEFDPSLLSSEAYTAYGLTVGGAQGVPTWVGRKLNNILSCTDLYLGEVGNQTQFVKANGAKIERTGLGDMNPLYQFDVNLEKVSDGILIGNYEPENLEPASRIAIYTSTYENIAEEVDFRISPSGAFFEYNDTAERVIYVTAADNTWAVAADDPSWATVTKNSNGTASVVLTQNSGDANRTQNVTFTWTSPTTGITVTKTLQITQYDQEIVTAPITISGTVLDSKTGLPLIGGNVVLRGYNGDSLLAILSGGMALDASGKFSQTLDVDSNVWAYFTAIRASVSAPNYTSETFTIATPSFEDASTNGVSFGTLRLETIPNSRIPIYTLAYETEDAVAPTPIRIFGKVFDSGGMALSGATVEIRVDSILIGTTQVDASGNWSIIWDTDEQGFLNMYSLQHKISMTGYNDYTFDYKYNNFPGYSYAVRDGLNLSSTYLTVKK